MNRTFGALENSKTFNMNDSIISSSKQYMKFQYTVRDKAFIYKYWMSSHAKLKTGAAAFEKDHACTFYELFGLQICGIFTFSIFFPVEKRDNFFLYKTTNILKWTPYKNHAKTCKKNKLSCKIQFSINYLPLRSYWNKRGNLLLVNSIA